MASKSECSQKTKCSIDIDYKCHSPSQAKVVGQESFQQCSETEKKKKKFSSKNLSSSCSTANINVVSEAEKSEGEEKEKIRRVSSISISSVPPPNLYSTLGVYYGGRDFYSPPRTSTSTASNPTTTTTVNDEGNWWLGSGSVYY